MTILFDNQIFTWQKFGGISRYFCELMKELNGHAEYKLPLALSNNIYISKKNLRKRHPFFPNIDFKGKTRLLNMFNTFNTFIFTILNRFVFIREAIKGKWDIIHPTYYDPFFLKYINGTPFVITVHDMVHEKFFPRIHKKTIENKKKCIVHAERIIAISENTKKDIIEIYNVNPDKIDVIYHGQSADPNVEQKVENLPTNYILFVGQRGFYKNFNRFAKAMSMIIKKYPEYHIVCTGSPFTRDEKKMLLNYDIDDKTHQYFVNEKELTYLYKHATVFIFPSEYEGFGIPILEAFACGCPVALSNTSSFPEIAKDAGTYFDPLNVEDIEQALFRLIEDVGYREKCVMLGYQRVKNFSWKKMAQETLLTYNKAISEKKS